MCLLVASPNVRADMRDGLVAYWPLDDTGGTTAEEVINGLDGSLNGDPAWVAGKVGGAMDVDGAGDFASCGFDPLLMPEQEITLQAWVYVRVYNYYEAIAANIHDTGSSEGGYWLGTYAEGQFGWGVTTVDQTLAYYWTPAIYQENTWYHLVATYKSGEMRLWVNGSLTDGIDSTGMTGNLDYTEAPDEGFLIGRYEDDDETHDSDAIIDEVAVWNRVLTSDEISRLWNQGNGTIIPLVDPIEPVNNDTIVPIDIDLSWTSPVEFTAGGYDLYFGADPNIQSPHYDWEKKIDNAVANSWDPPDGLGSGNLAYLTKYYWQVDVYEPNLTGPTVHHVGPMWSFTTGPDTPVVLVDPENQTAAQGQTATFTIEQYNGDDYEWFKVNDSGPDISVGSGLCTGPTVALDINNVQQANEGDYYCVVNNTNGSDTSATAFLITERMVAEWGFELNLDDSVDGHDGTMIGDISMSYAGPPVVGTYAGGFDGVDDAVEVAYHETLNNGSFSVALWAKVTGGADTFRAPISSRDDGPQKGYLIYAASDNTWQFWTGSAASGWNANSAASVVLDEWVYLVGTFEATEAAGDSFVGTQKFYVNGVLADKDDNVVFTPNEDKRLLIGAGANEDPDAAYFFLGHIDAVQIYNHALDPYKIAELYTDIRTDETVCVEIDPFDVTGPLGVPDCLVTLLDLEEFAGNWLQCNRYPASACVP